MTMATTSTTTSPNVFGSAQQVIETVRSTRSRLPTLATLAVAEGDDFQAAGRTHGFLVLATTAHALLNFGIIGQAGIVGAMHEDMVRQAGSQQSGEVVLLLAGGLGAFGGNMVTGWWMDHFPSHYLFAACAFASAVNLAVMPHVSGLPAIATCNVLIQLGVGIGDCSYGALGWVARECGVSKDGAYTSIKNLGTGLGTAVLMGMAILLDYRSLAYTWSSVCLLAGSLILAMPSPTPPEGATVARETPGQALTIAWRETLVVCTGGLLSAVVVGIFVTSLNLTANWIGTAASRQLLLCMLCMNIFGQLMMAPIMQRLPPAAAHVILLSISAAGCLLTGVAFTQDKNYVLIYTGYSLMGATLLSNFAVVFTFMSSLVSMSGRRSSIIGLGAALNPFFSAAAAVMQPAVVWIVSACLLLVMAATVVLLEVFGAGFVQRPRID